MLKPVLLTPALIGTGWEEKNYYCKKSFSFSYIGWRVMSDSTISGICYYCKLIYMVLAKEVHFCFDLVCCAVCCWTKYYTICNGASVTPFHCIMIDWLWVFNAISAILQSYECKIFNIFQIDDGQNLVSFPSDSRSLRLLISKSLLRLLFKLSDFKSRLTEIRFLIG